MLIRVGCGHLMKATEQRTHVVLLVYYDGKGGSIFG